MKSLRSYRALLSLLSAGAVVVTLDAQTTPLTLAAAREKAIAANADIAAARARRAVDLAGVEIAKERPNPELAYEAARDAPKQALTFSFPIELGGKRGKRVSVAQAATATGEAEVDSIIATVVNDVRRAFVQALAGERSIALATGTRDLAVRARDAARARAAAGDVAEADVAQTELALAAADDEVTAARGEAAAARADLNVLMGQPPGTTLTLADELADANVPTVDAAVAQATRDNAELRVADRRIAEQTARRDLARAQRTPDLNAGGGITWSAQPEFAIGWRATAGITLPLFTTHRAGVMLEDAELIRLQAERTAIVSRITGRVAAALARVLAARERMTHFQTTTLPLIERVERYALAAYSGGQTPLAAYLQALQQTRDQRKAGLQATIDFQNALADLEQAIGATLR